jgi:CRP-like cAMP-binding protein
MYIAQSDLFHGMNNDFVKNVMELSFREDYEPGDLLFSKGHPARTFFILLKGHILLSHDEIGGVVHSIGRAGESFGWSSVVGGKAYTATARCQMSARVLKFDAELLRQVMENDPENGLIFYRRLAAGLGERLVQSYRGVTAFPQAEASVSFGAGNLAEPEAALA